MDKLLDELLALRQRRGMTIDELVDQAERLLPAVADRQTRYKVSDRPDVRTIRYYVTRGFLPRAEGYEGGRARYGGSHLLRLLLVKKLQAEQHTLARIGATLEGADDRRVLELLLNRDPGDIEQAPASASAPIKTSSPVVQAMHRLSFAGGASLDLPEAILSSPGECEALALELESAVAWLRGDPSPDPQEGEPS